MSCSPAVVHPGDSPAIAHLATVSEQTFVTPDTEQAVRKQLAVFLVLAEISPARPGTGVSKFPPDCEPCGERIVRFLAVSRACRTAPAAPPGSSPPVG